MKSNLLIFFSIFITPFSAGAASGKNPKMLQYHRNKRLERIERGRLAERMRAAPYSRWTLPSITAIGSAAALGYSMWKGDGETCQADVDAFSEEESPVEVDFVAPQGSKKERLIRGERLTFSYRRSEKHPPFFRLKNCGDSLVEVQITTKEGGKELITLHPQESAQLFIQ